MRGKLLLSGFCILVLLITSAAAADISSFPGMFIKDNKIDAIIIVGKHAKAEDVIGAIDIASVLTDAAGIHATESIAMLDTQVRDITAQNTIIVGGPCANSAAAKMLGYPADCMEGFKVGQAKIRLFEHDNGNIAMLVAGATALDTRTATSVLLDYSNPAYELKGKEVLIESIGYTELGIQKK